MRSSTELYETKYFAPQKHKGVRGVNVIMHFLVLTSLMDSESLFGIKCVVRKC